MCLGPPELRGSPGSHRLCPVVASKVPLGSGGNRMLHFLHQLRQAEENMVPATEGLTSQTRKTFLSCRLIVKPAWAMQLCLAPLRLEACNESFLSGCSEHSNKKDPQLQPAGSSTSCLPGWIALHHSGRQLDNQLFWAILGPITFWQSGRGRGGVIYCLWPICHLPCWQNWLSSGWLGLWIVNIVVWGIPPGPVLWGKFSLILSEDMGRMVGGVKPTTSMLKPCLCWLIKEARGWVGGLHKWLCMIINRDKREGKYLGIPPPPESMGLITDPFPPNPQGGGIFFYLL